MGKEDLITWKVKTVRNNDKLPEEILTEEEVKRIAEAAYFKRDKAFVLALYESGARIGEFLPLKIKHLSFDEYGAILHVRGKTGSRRIRLIASAPALQEWLGEHPAKENPEAYLWCKVPTPNNPKWKNEPLSYNYTCRMIKELAKKAGVKKKVNPHAFRHARATFLANFLTEAQMKEFFGWVGDSDMAAGYVHLSGRDVDNALLGVYGITEGEKAKEPAIKVKVCPRCKEKNDPAAKFCRRCYLPLDQEYSQRDKLEALLVSFFQELAEKFPEIKKLFYETVKRERAEDILES